MSSSFIWCRRGHLVSSGLVGLIALVHSGVTPILYRSWSSDAVWFLGTGLGLLLLAILNLVHVGVEPCGYVSAPVVRWANWVFLLFGAGALVAIPEPQAYVLVLAMAGQAVAGQRTLRGPD